MYTMPCDKCLKVFKSPEFKPGGKHLCENCRAAEEEEKCWSSGTSKIRSRIEHHENEIKRLNAMLELPPNFIGSVNRHVEKMAIVQPSVYTREWQNAQIEKVQEYALLAPRLASIAKDLFQELLSYRTEHPS